MMIIIMMMIIVIIIIMYNPVCPIMFTSTQKCTSKGITLGGP